MFDLLEPAAEDLACALATIPGVDSIWRVDGVTLDLYPVVTLIAQAEVICLPYEVLSEVFYGHLERFSVIKPWGITSATLIVGPEDVINKENAYRLS